MNNLAPILQLIRSGNNPEAIVMNMLQQQVGNNPFGQNLLKLAQNKDTKGIEQIARNLCASRGLNFDDEFAKFKQQLKL